MSRKRFRAEVYLPVQPTIAYHEARGQLITEFSYGFGGCTVSDELEGWYLSQREDLTPDRITLIWSDTPPIDRKQERVVRLWLETWKLILIQDLNQEDVLITFWPLEHI